MADLIDRLAGVEDRPKIPAHQFTGALRLYVYGLKTRPQFAAYFDLQGSEATQATALANAIDAVSGVALKIAFCMRVEAVALLLEYPGDTFYHDGSGNIIKANVLADLGI